MSIPRIPPIAVLALAAALLAACGTDEGAGFVADADQACTDAAVETEEARKEVGAIHGPGDRALLLERLGPIRGELADELGEIEAPGDRAADYERFVTAQRRRAEATERTLDALRAERDRELAAAEAEDAGARRRAASLGTELGFEECSEAVPEDVREEAIDSVTRFLTTGTPEEACELLTERLLISEHGGEQRCERAEGERSPAREVTVESMQGVADVSVEATVAVRGGTRGGRRLLVRLALEGGEYRVDGIQGVG